MAARSSSRTNDPAGAGERFGALLRSPAGRWLTRLAVGATVLLVVGMVVRQAKAQAYRLPAYRLDGRSLRFVDLPGWVDAAMRSALQDPRRLAFGVSVFDPEAESRIRDVVARHPMVREVRRVTIEYPRLATVSVRLRVPLARVAVGGTAEDGYEVLADDQHLLDPVPYRRWLEETRVWLPLVTGIRSRPPPVGEAWEDREEQVAEAAEAARVAQRLHRDLNGRIVVARIDVARFPARPEERADGEVRFHLADGRTVEWGRTDRDPIEVGEDPYDLKLRRLAAWLEDESLQGRRRLDVRYRMKFESASRGS